MNNLDQYYTKDDIAIHCINKVKTFIDISKYTIIEPSAGTGAFFKYLPQAIGLDLEPKYQGIIKQDFLEYIPNSNNNIIIGNPPFGKNSSLALKFFNKSADFADYICFILPRTFRKPTIVNKLNKYFHLQYEEILPKNSFIYLDKSYDVPCVFQIWAKKEYNREYIDTNIICKHIEFTTFDNCDYMIRRVGGLAGKVIPKDPKYSISSNYCIKSSNKIKELLNNSYDELNTIASDVAGNPSLSKYELRYYINKQF